MNEKLKAFVYDGAFPLEFLTPYEKVRSDGRGQGGCQILDGHGVPIAEVEVGDLLARASDGQVLVITTDSAGDADANQTEKQISLGK